MAIPGSRGGSKKSVGSIWDLDWKLTSIVHGDSYKVVDRSTRQNLLVWISRVPLEKGEEKGFLRRMSRLVSFSTLPVVAHGIDRLGVGYVALQIEGCSPLESNKPSLLEARYRFVECVAKIARFHEAGLALENICPGSFVLDADQEVAFVGFLGGFSVSDMAAVPLEVRACLPVSTLSGLLSGVKADVYALAVLGLRLFGAQFPPSGINPEEVDQYLERIPDSAPRWIPHVLGPIVKQPQRSALRDAVDLLSALAEQERRAPPSMLESGPKGSGEDAKLVGNKRVSLELLLSVQEIATRVRLRDKSLRQPFMRRFIRGSVSQLLVICILAFVAIKAGLIPLAWLSENLSWSSQSLKLAPLNVPTGVERKDETSDGSTQSFADLIANLERISPGENHDDLWQVVFTRLTEKGYHTTAAMTASAVSDGAGPVRQPAALASVVHPEISTQERIHRLRSYEALVPESAGRVAAALAQDDPRDRELYRDFLMSSVRRLVAPSASDQVSERSTSALIVALGGRNEISAALNAALMQNISSADLWW